MKRVALNSAVFALLISINGERHSPKLLYAPDVPPCRHSRGSLGLRSHKHHLATGVNRGRGPSSLGKRDSALAILLVELRVSPPQRNVHHVNAAAHVHGAHHVRHRDGNSWPVNGCRVGVCALQLLRAQEAAVTEWRVGVEVVGEAVCVCTRRSDMCVPQCNVDGSTHDQADDASQR